MPIAPSTRLAALALGLVAAAFFSITFVFGRNMATEAAHWAWISSLRYLLTMPLLALACLPSSRWQLGLRLFKASSTSWVTWGTVGFVGFYVPVTIAVQSVPGWLVAALWPTTIVSALLMAPLVYRDDRRKVSRRMVAGAIPVLAGVAVLSADRAAQENVATAGLAIALIVLGGVAYPLGNRKTMLLVERFGTGIPSIARLFAMMLGSLPAWLVVAAFGASESGWPSGSTVAQSAMVALGSGLIATLLFFAATDLVRRDTAGLAAVDATQAAEVPCALLLEIVFLGAALPSPTSGWGIVLTIGGIVLLAWLQLPRTASSPLAEPEAPR